MSELGRPEFKPTRAQRKRVTRLICCGMSQIDVARAVGISKPTLQKHFAEEIATGFAQGRAEVIGMLYEAAEAGNVSAQRKLEEMSRIAGAEAALDAKPEFAPKLGKKDEAVVAAQTAGVDTEWGGDLMTPGAALPN